MSEITFFDDYPLTQDPFPKELPLGLPLAARIENIGQCFFGTHEYIVSDIYTPARPYYGYTAASDPPPARRALVVYLPQSMDEQMLRQANHSNLLRCRIIVETIAARGYSVDIIDWSDPQPELHEPYDLIFCLTAANAPLIERLAQLAPIIYFATEQYLPVQREAFQARVRRSGLRRQWHLRKAYSHERSATLPNAKAIIVVGNAVTAATYRSLQVPTFQVDNVVLAFQPPDLISKDFSESRRHFIWLGSSSMLHKGLDLVLEAFAQQPDLHLWVCGPLIFENEREFVQTYRRELFHTPNIHPLGWINTLSPEFVALTNGCAFMLYPSCSEGQSGGVLNCMAQGVIPIVTREVGIDIDDFGVLLSDTRIGTIRRVAWQMSELSPERCAIMALKATQAAAEHYRADRFRTDFDAILETILESKTLT